MHPYPHPGVFGKRVRKYVKKGELVLGAAECARSMKTKDKGLATIRAFQNGKAWAHGRDACVRGGIAKPKRGEVRAWQETIRDSQGSAQKALLSVRCGRGAFYGTRGLGSR